MIWLKFITPTNILILLVVLLLCTAGFFKYQVSERNITIMQQESTIELLNNQVNVYKRNMEAIKIQAGQMAKINNGTNDIKTKIDRLINKPQPKPPVIIPGTTSVLPQTGTLVTNKPPETPPVETGDTYDDEVYNLDNDIINRFNTGMQLE